MKCEVEKETLGLASLIISEERKDKKSIVRFLIIVLVVSLLISNAFSAIVAWKAIDFINGYEFESTEVKVESNTGPAIYQNTNEGDNDINVNSPSEGKNSNSEGK
jgi:hypothetical protein